MTVPVPDQLEYISNADGVTKDYPYPTRFLQKDEIVVVLRDAAALIPPSISISIFQSREAHGLMADWYLSTMPRRKE